MGAMAQAAPRFTAGAAWGRGSSDVRKPVGIGRDFAGSSESSMRKYAAAAANSSTPRTRQGGSTHGTQTAPALSPMSEKISRFDRYSRNEGRWSWRRTSYEKNIVDLVKAERKIEEGIASALTEVEAVEAGLRYFDEFVMQPVCAKSTTPHVPVDASHEERRAACRRASEGSGGVSGRFYRKMANIGDAIAQSTDLKLSLKQRLDNFDRQRGINTATPPERDNGTTQSGTIVVAENPSVCDGNRDREGKPLQSAKERGAFPRQSSSAKHPEQTQLTARNKRTDNSGINCTTSSVRRILARSFGKAVMGVPRDNSVTNGMTDGNSNTGGVAALIYTGRSASSLSGQPPERARLFANTGSSTHSAAPLPGTRIEVRSLQFGTVPGSATPIPIPGPFTETVATKAKPNIPGGATDVDASSTPTASIGNGARLQKRPLPRVAMIASSSRNARAAGGAGGDDTSHKPPLLVKTKDFDPDKLECVLRHEASLAERAEQVENLREATRRKSLFRARPLPACLGSDGGNSAASGGRHGGNNSARRQALKVETRPDLLAALDQDPEARELLEKIRKVNPHAEIASAVKLSTHSALSRSVGAAEPARPSLRGCTVLSQPASTPPATEKKPDTRTVEPARNGEGVQQEAVGWEEGGGQQIGGRGVERGYSKRRSLMGRMLENGTSMLDRHKEWVKARSKKVLESRRRAEEEKLREGKADVLEAGVSEKSWMVAKAQHIHSLERQQAEERIRESIREARRRASIVRAEREREILERQTAALAAALVSTEARASRTAPLGRAGSKRPRRPALPQRARSHGGDHNGAAATVKHLVAAELAPPTVATASVVEQMSEDEFYRAAVERIMDQERAGGCGDKRWSSGNGGGRRSTDGALNGQGYNDGGGGSNGNRSGEQTSNNHVSCCRNNKGSRWGVDAEQATITRSTAAVHLPGFESSLADYGTKNSRKTSTDVDGVGVRRQRSYESASVGFALGGKRTQSKIPRPDCRSASLGANAIPVVASRRRAVIPVRGVIGSDADVNTAGRYPRMKRAVVRVGRRKVGRNPAATEIHDATTGTPLERASPRGGISVGRSSSLLSLFEAQSVERYHGDSISNMIAVGGTADVVDHSADPFSLEDRFGDGKVETAKREDGEITDPRGLGANRGEEQSRWSGGRARNSDEGREHGRGDAEWDFLDEFASARGDELQSINRSGTPSGSRGPDVGVDCGGSSCEGGRKGNYLDCGADFVHYSGAFPISYPQERRFSDETRSRAKDMHDRRAAPNGKAAGSAGNEVASRNPAAVNGYDSDGKFSLWSTDDGGGSQTADRGLSSVGFGDDFTHDSGAGQGVTLAEGAGEVEHYSGYAGSPGDVWDTFEGKTRHFFDPATSSADKGRFRVRDPRLFDPCSMRRTTYDGRDAIVGGASDNRSSIEGVTLLLGRRSSEQGGRPEGQEQVITVMFDRSKFNEDEARRWWGQNRSKVDTATG